MTADGEHTRARLVAEARDLYLEAGLAHTSLREVARRVGVVPSAVYRHYDSKQALLRDVCSEGFRIFSSYLLRALSAPTAPERLTASAEQYLRFGLEHPRDYRFIFMSSAEDVATLGPIQKGKEPEPTFQFLVDRVRECMQARVLKKGDPEQVALLIWSHVHGLVSLRLSGQLGSIGSDAAFAAFYERAVEQLVAGLGR
jgi:AcrR family transcriptional regulator